jgi:hypothetical protein
MSTQLQLFRDISSTATNSQVRCLIPKQLLNDASTTTPTTIKEG